MVAIWLLYVAAIYSQVAISLVGVRLNVVAEMLLKCRYMLLGQRQMQIFLHCGIIRAFYALIVKFIDVYITNVCRINISNSFINVYYYD